MKYPQDWDLHVANYHWSIRDCWRIPLYSWPRKARRAFIVTLPLTVAPILVAYTALCLYALIKEFCEAFGEFWSYGE